MKLQLTTASLHIMWLQVSIDSPTASAHTVNVSTHAFHYLLQALRLYCLGMQVHVHI